MARTDTIACLRCGTRFHEVCVVHSLDDAQTQDGPLINTKLRNLHDCADDSMSQVKDAGALEGGAEGLEEVVSAWDAPYQQLNDEDDGDTSPDYNVSTLRCFRSVRFTQQQFIYKC